LITFYCVFIHVIVYLTDELQDEKQNENDELQSEKQCENDGLQSEKQSEKQSENEVWKRVCLQLYHHLPG
jgi:Ca2+-dependent lipid-binding protein